MMISTASYPDPSKLPAPEPTSTTRLEQLGSHTFATLAFNSTSCPPLYSPPYFTAFQRCDAMLAAGLPAGWELKPGSAWTPSWLLYNGANYNGTWTSQCLAEVQPSKGALPPPPTADASVVAAAAVLPESPLPALAHEPLSSRSLRGSTSAPPICAVMLEFETVYYGTWVPPHAPNTAINIDGGSDGQTAKDDVNGIIVLPTSTDTPFFGLRLVAITLATGAVQTIGNNWPYAPAGFSGVNGLFSAVEHDARFGFVVLLTEVSKIGPVPTRALEPGTPLGWTVAATVDVTTGRSTALTADLTPALVAFPPLVGGLSALDAARGTLWLVSADDAAQPFGPTTGCSASSTAARPRRRIPRGRGTVSSAPLPLPPQPPQSPQAAANTSFLGVQLTTAPSLHAAAPTALPSLGGGFIVTAVEFSAALDALVTLEFDASGITPPYWHLAPARVAVYPVNGTSPSVLGVVANGQISPNVGASQVSADGLFVYFGAMQGSAEFESAALITVDLGARSLSLVNAAPTDDYDVFNLYRC